SNTYSEMLTLVERKRELETELSGLTSFQIINSNVVFETSKSIVKSLILFVFIGGMLGLTCASIIHLRKLLRELKQD
ncbi:MAG TPA: hypothetical protein PLW23_05315, partial [Bacteroidales bacterium]|nr:hypothetical protein [Bacteroidales bacterium]